MSIIERACSFGSSTRILSYSQIHVEPRLEHDLEHRAASQILVLKLTAQCFASAAITCN